MEMERKKTTVTFYIISPDISTVLSHSPRENGQSVNHYPLHTSSYLVTSCGCFISFFRLSNRGR